jgi:hypothetical protein
LHTGSHTLPKLGNPEKVPSFGLFKAPVNKLHSFLSDEFPTHYFLNKKQQH